MSASKRCRATTDRDGGELSLARRSGYDSLMGVVPGDLVLKPELFFLELVEKVFVWVRAALFLVNSSMKGRVLRFQFLNLCLVHRRNSFLRMRLTAAASKSRIAAFVLSYLRRLDVGGVQLVAPKKASRRHKQRMTSPYCAARMATQR